MGGNRGFVLLLLSAAAASAAPFSCASSADCALNGVCNASRVCACDAAWDTAPGAALGCTALALLPATRATGLHSVDGGSNTSSWGGSVLQDGATGLWHMWASEITAHCGINAWTYNSHIVHATSPTPLGRYQRDTEFSGVFSHEPTAVRDPATGEWAVFYTAAIPSGCPPCACSDGSTTAACEGRPKYGKQGPTYVTWAPTPAGPWSPPLLLLSEGAREADTNLAPYIFANGSLVGLWRTHPGASPGSIPHLVTAGHWKNASSYAWHSAPILPLSLPEDVGLEDPHLYRDARGAFHALFHAFSLNGSAGDYGGHAFSEDGGWSWTWTGLAFDSRVVFSDGSSSDFLGRQRPHLVFGGEGSAAAAGPLGLTNGVIYKDASTEGSDACFTLVQPVRT
jgi:hypothetical protein